MIEQNASPDAELRIRDLERGMRILMAAPVAAISILPIWTLLGVPKFEKIFEDMLGTGRKLPDLTLFVMAYHTWITGLVVMWVGFCIWAAVSMRRFTHAAIICCAGLLTLLLVQVTVQWALWAPIGVIIQQMQSGA